MLRQLIVATPLQSQIRDLVSELVRLAFQPCSHCDLRLVNLQLDTHWAIFQTAAWRASHETELRETLQSLEGKVSARFCCCSFCLVLEHFNSFDLVAFSILKRLTKRSSSRLRKRSSKQTMMTTLTRPARAKQTAKPAQRASRKRKPRRKRAAKPNNRRTRRMQKCHPRMAKQLLRHQRRRPRIASCWRCSQS